MTEASIFRGTSAAVLQLLIAARANGVLVNRTKLAKLLYLADLRAVESDLPPGTSVEWRWRHYGPYSDNLREIEGDLELAGIVQVAEAITFYGSRETRLRLVAGAPQVEIDAQFAEIIDGVVREYGRLSASQLRDLTYQTQPMLSAIALGRREVRLDLAGGDPFPDLEPSLAHLRRVATTMPPLESDDPEGIAELAKEISDWSGLRSKATSEMLDSE